MRVFPGFDVKPEGFDEMCAAAGVRPVSSAVNTHNFPYGSNVNRKVTFVVLGGDQKGPFTPTRDLLSSMRAARVTGKRLRFATPEELLAFWAKESSYCNEQFNMNPGDPNNPAPRKFPMGLLLADPPKLGDDERTSCLFVLGGCELSVGYTETLAASEYRWLFAVDEAA